MGQQLRYKEEKQHIGKVEMFPHASVDSNKYLPCHGQVLLIADYPLLYAKLGTSYGGDGITTFALMDTRGEFIRGTDNGRGVDPGRGLGSFQNHAVQDHQHRHRNGNNLNAYGDYAAGAPGGPSSSPLTTGMATGNISSETRPRNLAMDFYIRYAI